MALRIALMVSALIFAMIGFSQGIFLPLAGLLALLAAIVVAPIAGAFLVNLLLQATHWNPLEEPLAKTIGIFVVGTLVYSSIGKMGLHFHREQIRKRGMLRGVDRLLGALLGAVVGVALVLAVVALLRRQFAWDTSL